MRTLLAIILLCTATTAAVAGGIDYPRNFDRSAAIQQRRMALIHKLEGVDVIQSTRTGDTGTFLFTGKNWHRLSRSDKSAFASVVTAYYWAQDPDHYRLTIRDGKTGAAIGGFMQATGLY